MRRPRVLLVGEAGESRRRLRRHLRSRKVGTVSVADCGEATMTLAAAETNDPHANAIAAIVLDAQGPVSHVNPFRDMMQLERPELAVWTFPPSHAGPEEFGLLGAALEHAIQKSQERSRIAAEHGPDRYEDRTNTPLHGYRLGELQSRSRLMQDLARDLPRIAKSELTVLIEGETGTGKELVAAAIHRDSVRHQREFFAVNCGALPESLLESELFGHVEGAFTGADKNRRGYFELADGGTLFLDELTSISDAMQVALLRVLDQGEVRPVGGSSTLQVDVRVIAAANERLERAVKRGAFREDLYHRLSVARLFVPPLRKRIEDVPLLAEVFRKKTCRLTGREEILDFAPECMERLLAYRWPGNVRELKNVIERTIVLGQGPSLRPKHLPFRLRPKIDPLVAQLPEFDIEAPMEEVVGRVRDAMESEYLRRVLRRYDGHLGKAAAHAGMHRRTLYNKMRALGLSRHEYK